MGIIIQALFPGGCFKNKWDKWVKIHLVLLGKALPNPKIEEKKKKKKTGVFPEVSVRAMGPKCFKSRKLLTLEILSKYISFWLRKGEGEGGKGGVERDCHQSIVNMNWIILQWGYFNTGNENCSVLWRIDNLTIVHWEWMTAVALELGEQHKMNECYEFFQNGPLFHTSLYQPQINTCQLFTLSANLASLDKPMCYQRPQSASVMSLLSGFAAAVKCQVKMPRKIYTASQ